MDISMLITLIIFAVALVSVIFYEKKPFDIIAKVIFVLCAASAVYVGILDITIGAIMPAIGQFLSAVLWLMIAFCMTKKTK